MVGRVAKKVIAEIEAMERKGGPAPVLDAIRGAGPVEVPADVPPATFVWMKSYQYLVRVGSALAGTRTLADFAEDVLAVDEEYSPHGPPDSPISDSFFVGWWLIDLPIGDGESVATIAADVCERFGAPREELERMRVLAGTHLRVLRRERSAGSTARLVDLVTGDQLEVGLVAPWDGDLWLARALPDLCFTPYALESEDAETEWQDYFTRHLGDAAGEPLRDLYRRHMRSETPNFWFEFILDSYSHGDEHTLFLRGIPDRPDSFPGLPEDLELIDELPLETGRDHLLRGVLRTDLLMDALSDFMAARESFELDEIEPDEETLLDPMLMAYAMYGIAQPDGSTFLQSFLAAPPPELGPDDLADLRAIEAGWFSLFEVVHVKLDEGIELKDLLRRKKIWVDEKLATREIALGDLLAAWIEDHGGRYVLEGANLHFPRMLAESARGLVKDYYTSLSKEQPLKQRLSLIAPVVAALHEAMRERPPIPTILNEDGEEMVFSQARYEVTGDAAGRLTAAGWSGDGDSYVLIEGEKLLASVEIEGGRLMLFATSPRQLEKAKARLAAAVGDAAVHKTDVFEDAQVAVAEGMSELGDDPEKLTPEMQAELRVYLEEELNAWLDIPIPLLGDRTPRQAVRTKRGKEDVKMMLLEQERMLEATEQLDEPIDFRPLWASLGLEYPS